MYFQRKPTILFRNYGDFGYLTDNSNFGYKFIGEPVIGDRILSQSAAIILESLGKRPMTVEEVSEIAIKEFSGVDFSTLVDDVKELFNLLTNDGFLICRDDIDDAQDLISSENCHFVYTKSSQCNSGSTDTSTQFFFQQYFDKLPFPTSVHVEIAAACNERCVHCYLPHENKAGFMPLKRVKNLIKQCNDLKILHVTLSGGEPLLHPDFIEILSLCKENDLSVNVLSNLTCLDEDIIAEMASNPLLGVQASLYSLDETVHDAITGVEGSCKKTVQSILDLVHRHIPIQISCPIMKRNYDNYAGVKAWGTNIGISVSADYVIIGRCDGSSSNLQNRLQVDEIAKIIKEELKSPTSRTALSEEVRKNKARSQDDYICGVCGSSLCVGINGDVFPCAGWEGCVIGSLNELSLKEIWYHSEKAKRLRNLKRKDFPKCISCDCSDYCVLCLVRNANENLELNPLCVSDFFCEVARVKKQIAEEMGI